MLQLSEVRVFSRGAPQTDRVSISPYAAIRASIATGTSRHSEQEELLKARKGKRQ